MDNTDVQHPDPSVTQIAKRVLWHCAVRTERVPHLSCCSLHGLRVLDELCHYPLQRCCRCLAACSEEVLLVTHSTEVGQL